MITSINVSRFPLLLTPTFGRAAALCLFLIPVVLRALWRMISGFEVGARLFNYIWESRKFPPTHSGFINCQSVSDRPT